MARAYYTLVASLPHLPHFEVAEWLPLSRKQIDQRLTMLSAEDHEQLELAEGLVRWQHQPITRTTRQMVADYRHLMNVITNPHLRRFVELRMGHRTALVALRRRRRDPKRPAPGRVWGLGPFVRRIESAWDRPDLGLGALFPWLPRAHELLENGDALELNRVMMNAVWRYLARLDDAHPFGFEQVFSFVFRWDILQRWLTYEPKAATARFTELIREVTRDHQQLFQ